MKWLNLYIYIYAFIIKTICARENLIAVLESALKMLSRQHKIISDEKSFSASVIVYTHIYIYI